mgnify:CR=1 FL=1
MRTAKKYRITCAEQENLRATGNVADKLFRNSNNYASKISERRSKIENPKIGWKFDGV